MRSKQGIIGLAIVLCITTVTWFSTFNLAEGAEQTYDVNACVSLDFSPLIQSKEITVGIWNGYGIMRSNNEGKVLDNCTVHSQGVMTVEGKNRTVNGYMKYFDPDGDFVIFRYIVNPGEKEATTTLLFGTGKYKGIKGGGKAKRIAAGKPIVEGTAQFCNNHKGTFTLPE
jgi:hypothetical protein